MRFTSQVIRHGIVRVLAQQRSYNLKWYLRNGRARANRRNAFALAQLLRAQFGVSGNDTISRCFPVHPILRFNKVPKHVLPETRFVRRALSALRLATRMLSEPTIKALTTARKLLTGQVARITNPRHVGSLKHKGHRTLKITPLQ